VRFLSLARKLKNGRIVGKGNPDLTGIAENSKQTHSGELFVCLPGAKVDGRVYAEEAVRSGARAVVAQEQPLKGLAVPQLVVKDSREALARLAHLYYGDPSKKVKVIGVTGTKGKTTTTYLIRSILERAGRPAGLIGTIAYQIGKKTYEANNTTPSSLTIVKLLDEMRRQKCGWAVMEVSSHSLEMKRVLGVEFRGAVFTNLGRDHMDYHKNFTNYFKAKRRLFTEFKSVKARAVNADDNYGQKLLKELKSKAVGFGLKAKCAYRAVKVEHRPGFIGFEVQGRAFEAPLTGLFNIYNSLAAISILRELGLPWEVLQDGLKHAPAVPGRFEEVAAGQDFTVLVDYAHTPDALKQALIASREILGKKSHHKLISVFGCGGDRDRTKRPLMGKISSQLADMTVVTSDNPRTEKPSAILEDILRGIAYPLLQNGHRRVWVEEDRGAAIRLALSMAKKGDLVLIAGKGHETYQVIGEEKQHFDDREVAREILKDLLPPSPAAPQRRVSGQDAKNGKRQNAQ
jgi:UDP-N-acetylmuramoyl-L-alanyl-D-glutamate--2,6-diaminopimelate ligase